MQKTARCLLAAPGVVDLVQPARQQHVGGTGIGIGAMPLHQRDLVQRGCMPGVVGEEGRARAVRPGSTGCRKVRCARSCSCPSRTSLRSRTDPARRDRAARRSAPSDTCPAASPKMTEATTRRASPSARAAVACRRTDRPGIRPHRRSASSGHDSGGAGARSASPPRNAPACSLPRSARPRRRAVRPDIRSIRRRTRCRP